jgi:hypothetical protein
MLRRLAVVGACTLAITMLAPATAQADTRTLVDGAGDVWEPFTDFENREHTRHPDRRQGDILRAFFAHKQRQIVIRIKYAELDRIGSRHSINVRLHPNAGGNHWASVHATRGNDWRGVSMIEPVDGSGPLDCGISHRMDYAQDRALIRVPRRCMGNPRWIQASMTHGHIINDRFFTDNPSNHGPSVRMPPNTAPVRRR